MNRVLERKIKRTIKENARPYVIKSPIGSCNVCIRCYKYRYDDSLKDIKIKGLEEIKLLIIG